MQRWGQQRVKLFPTSLNGPGSNPRGCLFVLNCSAKKPASIDFTDKAVPRLDAHSARIHGCSAADLKPVVGATKRWGRPFARLSRPALKRRQKQQLFKVRMKARPKFAELSCSKAGPGANNSISTKPRLVQPNYPARASDGVTGELSSSCITWLTCCS